MSKKRQPSEWTVCAICHEKPAGRKLAADHCHETGRERGFLCTRCNMGIGYFQDNPELLWRAIRYLSRYSGDRFFLHKLQEVAEDATPWPHSLYQAIELLSEFC